MEIIKDNLLISLEHHIDIKYLLESDSEIDKLIKSIDDYSKTLKNFLDSLDEGAENLKNAASTVNTSDDHFQIVINESSEEMQKGAKYLFHATKHTESLTQTFSGIISSLVSSATSFDKLNTSNWTY